MADPPLVYAAAGLRPVAPGGTRVRVLRRRPQQEGAGEDASGDNREEEAWRTLLVEAVEDLNASFLRAAVPFLCVLDEDEAGYTLHVRRQGPGAEPADVEEETMEPQDLPRWLARIRTGLGLLVDETA